MADSAAWYGEHSPRLWHLSSNGPVSAPAAWWIHHPPALLLHPEKAIQLAMRCRGLACLRQVQPMPVVAERHPQAAASVAAAGASTT